MIHCRQQCLSSSSGFDRFRSITPLFCFFNSSWVASTIFLKQVNTGLTAFQGALLLVSENHLTATSAFVRRIFAVVLLSLYHHVEYPLNYRMSPSFFPVSCKRTRNGSFISTFFSVSINVTNDLCDMSGTLSKMIVKYFAFLISVKIFSLTDPSRSEINAFYVVRKKQLANFLSDSD